MRRRAGRSPSSSTCLPRSSPRRAMRSGSSRSAREHHRAPSELDDLREAQRRGRRSSCRGPRSRRGPRTAPTAGPRRTRRRVAGRRRPRRRLGVRRRRPGMGPRRAAIAAARRAPRADSTPVPRSASTCNWPMPRWSSPADATTSWRLAASKLPRRAAIAADLVRDFEQHVLAIREQHRRRPTLIAILDRRVCRDGADPAFRSPAVPPNPLPITAEIPGREWQLADNAKRP